MNIVKQIIQAPAIVELSPQKCSSVQLEYDLAFRLLRGCGLLRLLVTPDNDGVSEGGEGGEGLGICKDSSGWDVSSGAIDSEGAGE